MKVSPFTEGFHKSTAIAKGSGGLCGPGSREGSRIEDLPVLVAVNC